MSIYYITHGRSAIVVGGGASRVVYFLLVSCVHFVYVGDCDQPLLARDSL